MRKSFIILIILTIIPVYFHGCQAQAGNEITPEAVKEKIALQDSLIIIDVRTPEEYVGDLGHIRGSILRPLSEIDTWWGECEQKKSQMIIFVCRSGNRSGVATRFFLEQKFENVYNMTGGMREWNRLGYPVSRETE